MSLILIIVVVLLLCGGGWGYSRSPYYTRYGYAGGGIGLIGLVLIILVFCLLFGYPAGCSFPHYYR